MDIKNIPLLTADDVECRIQQVREKPGSKGEVQAILLLYKDARCDMKYLDGLFGIYGWKRSHRVIDGRLYCTVSIYDKDKKEWVDKEDVGTESNTEKEKGQASDAFKRACFNIGIGRELYTSPPIKITLRDKEYTERNGKLTSYASFRVKEIGYDDKRTIIDLVITDRFGNERFVFKNGKEAATGGTSGNSRNTQRSAPTANNSTGQSGSAEQDFASYEDQKKIHALIIEKFGGWDAKSKAVCAAILKKYGATKFQNIPAKSVDAILQEIRAAESV